MRGKSLVKFGLFSAIALFSYNNINGQVVDAVKKAANKTKGVTVDVAKKTADVTKNAAGATVKGAQKVGNYTISVTENVAGKFSEGGKWFTTTTWDGTRWVSKKVWYAAKKVGTSTKNTVVGEENPKP